MILEFFIHNLILILMPNEQCGLCWDLEFYKKGNKTHEGFRKHNHDFVKFDYFICAELFLQQYSSIINNILISKKK